jgi:predicted nuclease of predicted toxin-antitoxin system
MKILIDMNLSPDWVNFLNQAGHDAVHWSSVGKPADDDPTILRWARQDGRLLFTHDLDFGALLALARGSGPSVLQLRTHDVLPDAIGTLVARVLTDYADAISAGAFISVDEASARVRILPIK